MAVTKKKTTTKKDATKSETKMRYVRSGIVPKTVPAGRVLVHNHIFHAVDQPAGANGFRAWTQAPAVDLLKCSCGWSGLPHYRTKATPARCLLPGTWKEVVAERSRKTRAEPRE